MTTIALILISYKSKELNRCLAPWQTLKFGVVDNYGLMVSPPAPDVNLLVGATTALFKENADLGAVYDNKETEIQLQHNKTSGFIDHLEIIKDPILDYQSRDVLIQNYFKNQDVDYFWQLDSDEFYNYNEILATLNYIKKKPYCNYFCVEFKNYFGKTSDRTYVKGFTPTRIINNKTSHGPVKNFYWDNDAEFSNGQKTPQVGGQTIPANILSPEHQSWTYDTDPTSIIKKIDYQHRAIGCCSYKWDTENNRLTFDPSYYKKVGQEMPHVYQDSLL